MRQAAGRPSVSFIQAAAAGVDDSLVRLRLSLFVLACCLGGTLVSGGCSSAVRPFSQEHVEMRDYKPLSVPAATTVGVRWQKLQGLAAEEGWHLETFDETRGLMIAARMSKESTEIRERVRIVLRPDTTEIAVQTWWSRDRLPVEYAEAGKRLEDFTDANADES